MFLNFKILIVNSKKADCYQLLTLFLNHLINKI